MSGSRARESPGRPIQRSATTPIWVACEVSYMSLDVEDLLKIVLLLVVVLIVLEIIGEVLGWMAWLLGPFRPLLGLIIVVLIVLWLLDRI